MIRSALRSVSYLVEDVVSVAKWAVGEVVAELDYRLQPAHMRQGWAAELADIEAGIDVHEPNARYLQWGGPETWPQRTHCNRCGDGYRGEHICLRDQSSPVVPPTATGDRPAGVVADPPSAPPAGHPLVELIAEVLDEHHGWYGRRDGGYKYHPCICGDGSCYDHPEFARKHVAPLIAERIEKAIENTT